MKNKIEELFGKNQFHDKLLKERIPAEAYASLQRTIQEGAELNPQTASVIAQAMMEWAVERGATHYTHWFQPLTGFTAEKHDSFLEADEEGGMTLRLSGKRLIKGESDASSFPSGGLRSTFEARGYTAWDCTSPAFLKEDNGGITLYIPTAFCSYNGEALDKKTPLLRSMEALNKHALRILRLFGDKETTKVLSNVGAEQEYFLIDKAFLKQRWDIHLTGKTLMGAPPLKGQAATQHYYGAITDRVSRFMNELDEELWKLGIPSKTKHNEAAPCQYEMAPIYATVNIACDQNHLVMETMKKVADRQGLACLLNEKPFPYVNGSGKHNNWSIGTDTGHNLFEPGKTPYDNAQFLIFLSAVIRAVDKHAALLRLSCASASNDRRLGGDEAPPAIISIFVGDDLMDLIEKVKSNVEHPERTVTLRFGVPTLPEVYRDATDRNRTSPFAFTGNKFEFRMPGSSQSLSECNTVLNTIVAESLDHIATRLEMADDFEAEVREIFRDILFGHERILFNGDGYSKEWHEEAARRGLPIIKDTVEAIGVLKNVPTQRLYERYGVFTASELEARYEVLLEQYTEQIRLEGSVVADMARRQIMPVCVEHLSHFATSIVAARASGLDCKGMDEDMVDIDEAASLMRRRLIELERALKAPLPSDKARAAALARDDVLVKTQLLSKACDRLEKLLPRSIWPMPTFDDILYEEIQV
ncbi:MAG: glutamine synthetase III [Clostridia bacterium]|nr:glutamine synthetase III [Clostridia bacterium]